jgi:Fe-S-cluster containining protein
MQTVNLRSFRQMIRHKKRRISNFLTRLQKKAPDGLDGWIKAADQAVWAKTDCLDCANCCKTMSPTYTQKDIQRISGHLGMTAQAFRSKWLYRDKSGDWLNRNQPCQFLDLKTNKCTIYAVRPSDCAGFPHHRKKQTLNYMHVYKQNISFCPATFRVVELLMEKIKARE